MSRREYEGPPLDGTEQYITERPVQPGGDPEGETVYATEPDPEGECRTEDVVMPDEVRAAAAEDDEGRLPGGGGDCEREPVDLPDKTSQTTLEEWSR